MNGNPRGDFEARAHNIQLVAAPAALARLTACSKRITFPYRLRQINCHFAIGCNHLVLVYPIISLDPSIPTDAVPIGLSVLSHLSPTPYLVGNDETIELAFNLPVFERGSYIKLHVYNTDGFQHSIAAQVHLDEMPEED